jgi:hypothetical protein
LIFFQDSPTIAITVVVNEELRRLMDEQAHAIAAQHTSEE